MNQASFLSLAHKKKLRCEKFLDEMKAVIPWDKLCKVIKPHYSKGKLGRKPMDLEMMVKIHCLQQWYNLSDPGCEEAIYDRNSFQKFLGIDLLADEVPDETTILKFRHLLESHKLPKKIFKIINRYLTEQGLLMKEGTIVDATLIASAKSTKNKDKNNARSEGVFWGVLDKAKRNHSLSSSQRKRNKKLASVRAKVEHPFQVIKCQWHYYKTRYRGIEKNACQLYMLFSLHNIFKVRRILLAQV